MDALRGLTEDDIYAEILNASGPQPSVLFCEPAFISLVKRQIRRFESPGQRAEQGCLYGTVVPAFFLISSPRPCAHSNNALRPHYQASNALTWFTKSCRRCFVTVYTFR